MHKLTLLIPCHNDAKAIGNFLREIPKERLAAKGYQVEVLVVDNNSSDNTAAVARRAGARVVQEEKTGKGNALRRGFLSLAPDTDYVVMIDGDGTYDPREITRALEPLENGFCDVIVGSRLSGKIYADSMPVANRGFNWFCAHIVRLFYGANITDALAGFFAWKKSALDDVLPHLRSTGYSIEMEIITRLARMGHDIYSVPVSYHPRTGSVKTRPLDSWPILRTFFENLRWAPPFTSPRDK